MNDSVKNWRNDLLMLVIVYGLASVFLGFGESRTGAETSFTPSIGIGVVNVCAGIYFLCRKGGFTWHTMAKMAQACFVGSLIAAYSSYQALTVTAWNDSSYQYDFPLGLLISYGSALLGFLLGFLFGPARLFIVRRFAR